MAVNYSPDSAYAKEAIKYEARHRFGLEPGRPYVFEEFPKRMYKATRPATGGPVSFDGRDAGNELEQRNLQSRGYCCGQAEALAALEKHEFGVAELTANRHFHDRRMSEQAQREAAIADASTGAHLPSVPEKPRTRKPRTPKPSEVSNGV